MQRTCIQWPINLLLTLMCCTLLAYACNREQASPPPGVNTSVNTEAYTIGTLPDTADVNVQIRTATALWHKNQDSAKLLLLQIARKCIANNYNYGIVAIFTFLGNAFLEQAIYDSSVFYLHQAIPYALKLPVKDYTVKTYAYLGAVYYHNSQFSTAALYWYQALMLLESGQINNYKTKYTIYKFLGALWLNTGNLRSAVPYLEKAEFIAKIHKDSLRIVDAQCSKATIYYRKGELDSAIRYYEAVVNNPSANEITLENANLNLGKIYLEEQRKKQPQKSLYYFQKARRLAQAQQKNESVNIINAYLGTTYGELGNYEKAEMILSDVVHNKALELGTNVVNINRNLAFALRHNKKCEQAFDQIYTAMNLQDSLYQKKNLEMTGKLEVEYQVAKKDHEIAQKQLQISQQQSKIKERNLWIGGIATSGILLLISLISLFRNNRKKEEIAQLKFMMQGEEKERARIAHELHDGIISELSAVKMHFSAAEQEMSAYGPTNELKAAIAQLQEVTVELRKTSHNLMPEVLIQSGIGIAVRSFCEKLRKSTHIHIDFQRYGDIPRLNLEFELTIYRIIQELIQNTLKHAVASSILVQVTCDEQILTVTVEDNGKGISAVQMIDGMGLVNMKIRVKALGGHINIESNEDKGTSVYLEFALNRHQINNHKS